MINRADLEFAIGLRATPNSGLNDFRKHANFLPTLSAINNSMSGPKFRHFLAERLELKCSVKDRYEYIVERRTYDLIKMDSVSK